MGAAPRRCGLKHWAQSPWLSVRRRGTPWLSLGYKTLGGAQTDKEEPTTRRQGEGAPVKERREDVQDLAGLGKSKRRRKGRSPERLCTLHATPPTPNTRAPRKDPNTPQRAPPNGSREPLRDACNFGCHGNHKKLGSKSLAQAEKLSGYKNCVLTRGGDARFGLLSSSGPFPLSNTLQEHARALLRQATETAAF